MDTLEGTWSRRTFLACAAVAGSAAVFGLRSARAGAETALETTRIRLPEAPVTCWAPVYLAEELLKAEGFTDVRYVKTPPQGPSYALAQGSIDVCQDDTAGLLISIDAGRPVVILGGIHTGCWELFGGDSVRSVRDLKGKTVAAPERSSRQAFVAGLATFVGLNPNKDITWINHESGASMRLFAEGKIDAFMGFTPEPQELRAKKIGHVLIDFGADAPWSQYFCCMAAANREFTRKYPIATKRALRALLKATDLCASEPVRAAQLMVDRGVAGKYEYVLQSVQEIRFSKWRDYDAEDTVRFWALRLHEAGIIKTNPKKLVSQGTDWRFIADLRKELKA